MKLIRECGKEIYATAYNVDEERPEYFRLNSCNEEELKVRLLASCSVPHLFKPIIMYSYLYFSLEVYRLLLQNLLTQLEEDSRMLIS